MYNIYYKGGEKKMVKKIREFGKVIDALVELGLKIGTLVAVIKMILDSL